MDFPLAPSQAEQIARFTRETRHFALISIPSWDTKLSIIIAAHGRVMQYQQLYDAGMRHFGQPPGCFPPPAPIAETGYAALHEKAEYLFRKQLDQGSVQLTASAMELENTKSLLCALMWVGNLLQMAQLQLTCSISWRNVRLLIRPTPFPALTSDLEHDIGAVLAHYDASLILPKTSDAHNAALDAIVNAILEEQKSKHLLYTYAPLASSEVFLRALLVKAVTYTACKNLIAFWKLWLQYDPNVISAYMRNTIAAWCKCLIHHDVLPVDTTEAFVNSIPVQLPYSLYESRISPHPIDALAADLTSHFSLLPRDLRDLIARTLAANGMLSVCVRAKSSLVDQFTHYTPTEWANALHRASYNAYADLPVAEMIRIALNIPTREAYAVGVVDTLHAMAGARHFMRLTLLFSEGLALRRVVEHWMKIVHRLLDLEDVHDAMAVTSELQTEYMMQKLEGIRVRKIVLDGFGRNQKILEQVVPRQAKFTYKGTYQRSTFLSLFSPPFQMLEEVGRLSPITDADSFNEQLHYSIEPWQRFWKHAVLPPATVREADLWQMYTQRLLVWEGRPTMIALFGALLKLHAPAISYPGGDFNKEADDGGEGEEELDEP